MKTEYTREKLLDILTAYARQIERNGRDYPTVCLDDLKKSIAHVLKEAQK